MKIEEQVLSIEQMRHLQELGVDTSDASMAYYNISRDNQPDKWVLGIANKEVVSTMLSNGITERNPTYTIGDLIEKLPVSIDGVHGIPYHRKILIKGEYTVVRYMDGGDYCPLLYSRSLFIELLYDLLCEVAENHKELLEVKNE